MTKENTKKKRPTIKCENCGKEISTSCYKRHYEACTNPNSKLNNHKKDVYKVTHEGLNCIYCNREFKSLNALTQHELRCKENPNRKSYNNLGDYSNKYRKGQTKDTCEDIARQRATLLRKYEEGYISPVKGRKICFEYIYQEHNDAEISKWLKYLSENNFIIPELDITSHNEGYQVLAKHQVKSNNTVSLTFVHDYIANILLDGKLTKTNTVHHIDSNRMNNEVTNLLIFIDGTNHKRFHNSKYAYLIYDETTHLFSCKLLKDNSNT